MWQVVKEGLIPMALSKIWKENTASIFGNYLQNEMHLVTFSSALSFKLFDLN